jgi:hypothetical protein
MKKTVMKSANGPELAYSKLQQHRSDFAGLASVPGFRTRP